LMEYGGLVAFAWSELGSGRGRRSTGMSRRHTGKLLGRPIMNIKLYGTHATIRLCLAFFITVMVAPAPAQEATKGNPTLPSHPASWINSAPISNEMLAGKAAVLYFFEEACPRSVEAWPKVLLQAAKFDGTPVMFIAVNSGTPRPQLEAYLRKNQVTWPVICDADRSFENQFGFTISLENIRQVRLLMPDGAFKNGSFDNLEGSTVDALRDAKWKVEPKEIPSALQPAWLAIEFGKYPDAAQMLKKNLNGKGELKDAAQRLNQFVLDDLTAQVAAAEKSLMDDKKWDAYKRYSAVPLKFKGYAVPSDVAAKIKELAMDDAIKEELSAAKLLDMVLQNASKSAAGRKGAIRQLQNLVKDHPNTEAAQKAEQLLKEANQ
jgi:hypothetical protein